MGWWNQKRFLDALGCDGWFVAQTSAGAFNVEVDRESFSRAYYDNKQYSFGYALGLTEAQTIALLNMLAASPVIPAPVPVVEE